MFNSQKSYISLENSQPGLSVYINPPPCTPTCMFLLLVLCISPHSVALCVFSLAEFGGVDLGFSS